MRRYSMKSLSTFFEVLYKKKIPKKGRQMTILLKNQKNNSPFRWGFSRSPEILGDFPLEHFFLRFNGKQILSIFVAILLERRIIFISSKLKILTTSILACLGLIKPFIWRYIYIPILPERLVGAVCAPMPFILGIHRSMEGVFEDMETEDFTYVDLDERFVDTDPTDLLLLPSNLATRMIKNINEHLKTWFKTRNFPREELVTEFKKFFQAIFSDYKKYFSQDQETEKYDFDFESFRNSKSRRIKKYLDSIEETQMFNCFIEEKKENYNLKLKNTNKEEAKFKTSFQKIQLQQEQLIFGIQKNFQKIMKKQLPTSKQITSTKPKLKTKPLTNNQNNNNKNIQTRKTNPNKNKNNKNKSIKIPSPNSNKNDDIRLKIQKVMLQNNKNIKSNVPVVQQKFKNKGKQKIKDPIEKFKMKKNLKLNPITDININNDPDKEMLKVVSEIEKKRNRKRFKDRFSTNSYFVRVKPHRSILIENKDLLKEEMKQQLENFWKNINIQNKQNIKTYSKPKQQKKQNVENNNNSKASSNLYHNKFRNKNVFSINKKLNNNNKQYTNNNKKRSQTLYDVKRNTIDFKNIQLRPISKGGNAPLNNKKKNDFVNKNNNFKWNKNINNNNNKRYNFNNNTNYTNNSNRSNSNDSINTNIAINNKDSINANITINNKGNPPVKRRVPPPIPSRNRRKKTQLKQNLIKNETENHYYIKKTNVNNVNVNNKHHYDHYNRPVRKKNDQNNQRTIISKFPKPQKRSVTRPLNTTKITTFPTKQIPPNQRYPKKN
ncbi:receptor mediated endocytosis [Anaeramoeba flamelloides]|uniref:Receptor mediated endocytosis n=1 Tax=Anaeramoeba flamelloides TaxID=1746091 RepID=A0ABQ8ZD73_9EUKA|nr:receptor mediated endocytosis [Anaeramoeba flamelloides]